MPVSCKLLSIHGFTVIQQVVSTGLFGLLLLFTTTQLNLYSRSVLNQNESNLIEDTRTYLRDNIDCDKTFTDEVKGWCSSTTTSQYIPIRDKNNNLIFPKYDGNANPDYFTGQFTLRAKCLTDASDGFYKIDIEYSKVQAGYAGVNSGLVNAFARNPLSGQVYAWANLLSGVPYACAKAATLACFDPGFGVAGIVTRHLYQAINVGSSVNIQSDGKVVLAGYDRDASDDLANILRFNVDGSVDSSFGTSGYRRLRIHGNAEHTFLYHSSLQTDGKILAIGHNRYNVGENGSSLPYTSDAMAMTRLKTDGSLDTTFSGDGMLSFNYDSLEKKDEMGYGGILQQPDGKIVISGVLDQEVPSDNDRYDAVVVRFNSNGTLDSSFGTGGKVLKDISGNTKEKDDYLKAMILQPDGKIITAGLTLGSNYDFVLWRLNTNGTNDTSFGVSGIVKTAFGTGHDSARAIALQPDGKILVVGATQVGTYYQWVIARYLSSNGALDPSFNGIGYRIISALQTKSGDDDEPIRHRLQTATRVGLLPTGKILVSGTAYNGTNYDMAVAVLNLDGSLDTSFNSTGYMLIPVGSYDDYALGMAINNDGTVILGGQKYTAAGDTNSDFALVKFNPVGCQ